MNAGPIRSEQAPLHPTGLEGAEPQTAPGQTVCVAAFEPKRWRFSLAVGSVLAGSLPGTAWQLTQAQLWPAWAYGVLALLGCAMLFASCSGSRGLAWGTRAHALRRSRQRRARVCSCSGARLAVTAVLCLMAGALLGAAHTGVRALVFQAQALSPALEGQDVRVLGVVSELPRRDAHSQRFQLKVSQAWVRLPGQSALQEVVLPPQLLLSWYAQPSAPWETGAQPSVGEAAPEAQRVPAPPGGASLAAPVMPVVRAGERWEFTVRLRAPQGHRNPHGFDYELWLWEQGVQATGYVRSRSSAAEAAHAQTSDVPLRLGSTRQYPLAQWRQAVRDAIQERARQPGESAVWAGWGGASVEAGSSAQADQRARALGVVAALVTGDQGAIDREDWTVFRSTGVAHLMSISGLHITMFAWLAAAVLGVLWRASPRLMLWLPAPQAALVGGVLLATAYALFSGWGVPAQRTVCMLALVTVLRAGARRWPWPWVWLMVGAVVVLWDPWALLQAGFWLSFVAVGVLFASDAGLAHHLHDVRPSAGGRLLRQGGRLLREQWVVTLALTPLSLLLFQQVSGVGLVANLVAIPWVTLGVTPLAMLGLLWPPLWDGAAWAVQLLALGLGWLAQWPLATVSVAAAPLWAGVAGVLGGLLLVMRLPWTLRGWGLPLLLPVLLWQPPRPAEGSFDLLAADVGQGTAVLIRTARHSLLYDAGPRYSMHSDAGQRVLLPLLRALGERPTRLMLSHRDSDHTGGAEALLRAYPNMQLMGSLEAAHPLQALRPAQPCVAGQHWVWDGVRFDVWHPGEADARSSQSVRPNALSCVLSVSLEADSGATAEQQARTTVLLAGDIERAQELALVARSAQAGRSLRAQVLLVPHHGSRTSSSEPFLAAVAPRLAVVQSGWRNRFGHPAPSVLARYAAQGTRVLDSPACGALSWRSVNPQQVHCERVQAPRYWQHRPPPAAPWREEGARVDGVP